MDWQTIFNFMGGAVLMIGGALAKTLADDVKELRNVQADFPNVYARRDDVKNGFDKMSDQLTRIENKLDNKADK